MRGGGGVSFGRCPGRYWGWVVSQEKVHALVHSAVAADQGAELLPNFPVLGHVFYFFEREGFGHVHKHTPI